MTSDVIIDEEYILDMDTYVVGLKSNKKTGKASPVYYEELNAVLDRIEESVEDLESSLDPRTTSRLSRQNREGIYLKEGLITNIIIGVMLALVLIILII